MEIGKINFNHIDRLELLKAYNSYVCDRVFYFIQERVDLEFEGDINFNELIGQSQYFELNMEQYYKEFWNLDLSIKMYLYKHLAENYKEMYYIILNRNVKIMEDLIFMGREI
jgi:hypothetical protein